MTEQSTTAILVAYNSAGVIGAAIKSLLQQPEISDIIVVDNCSHDDTCEMIAREFPSVKLIENKKNEGFGRANNVALEKVKTPFAFLVNPDTVLEQGALDVLLAAAEKYSDAAIIAPSMTDERGAVHHSFKRNVFNRERCKDKYIAPEGDICAEFLSGAVMLLSMAHMKKVGFFDPNIFLFYEDDDLCLRVRQAGFGLVYVPAAKALHLMGGSSGAPKPESDFFKQKHMTWSRLYLEHKYFGVKAASKLRIKLDIINASKAGIYTLLYRKRKVNKLRGRMEGAYEFHSCLKSGRFS